MRLSYVEGFHPLTAAKESAILTIFGVVKVSTGVLQLEKLSACYALNGKIKLNADNNTQYALAA